MLEDLMRLFNSEQIRQASGDVFGRGNFFVDALFLFHSLDAQRDQVRDRAGEASHGTKKLETAVLSSLPIMIPSASLQRLFRDHVAPMHDLWDNLHQQNEKLRAARGLLLPRLMSGEIVV